MEQTAPSIWKALKQDFCELEEKELRAALCRTVHAEKNEVAGLRPNEARVQQWLDARGTRPTTVYSWLTHKNKTQYAKRYTQHRLEDKWRIFTEIKSEIGNAFPDKKPEEIRKHVLRIARWEYSEIKKLSEEELILRDMILRWKIRPATLNQWLINLVVPEDIRQRIEDGTLTISQAKNIYTNKERQRRAAIEIRILEEARQLVKEVLQ